MNVLAEISTQVLYKNFQVLIPTVSSTHQCHWDFFYRPKECKLIHVDLGFGFFLFFLKNDYNQILSSWVWVSREKGALFKRCTEVSILAFRVQEHGRASGPWQSSRCNTHILQGSPLTMVTTATQSTCHRAVACGPPRSNRTPGSLLTCLL